MLGESREAILTARHVQFCRIPCTPIAHIATLPIEPFVYLVSVLLDLGMSVSCSYHVITSSLLCLQSDNTRLKGKSHQDVISGFYFTSRSCIHTCFIPSQSARSLALARAVESPTTLTGRSVWEAIKLVLETMTSSTGPLSSPKRWISSITRRRIA